MTRKRKHLIALLLAAKIFTSYAVAEEHVRSIKDPTALTTLTRILEKGERGIVTESNFYVWQGKLSNHDKVLVDYLVESELYNLTNAEIFVRSINQDDVEDFINVLNDEKLRNAVGVVAVTSVRDE